MDFTSNILFKSLVEVYPLPIVISDLNNRYVFVNDSFVKALEHENDTTILDKTPQELGIRIDERDANLILESLLKNGRIQNMQISTKGSRPKTLMFSSRLIGNDYVLTITTDITELLVSDIQTPKAQEELNSMVAQKNAILESLNRDLKQRVEEMTRANRNLERLLREKSQKIRVQYDKLQEYLNMNSHEVRAPLARILGLVRILRIDPESTNDVIEKLDFTANELDQIVHRMNRALEQGLE